MSTVPKTTRRIDFWRWRHREAPSGQARRTVFRMLLDETGTFPEARPVPMPKPMEEPEAPRPDFVETRPEIGRLEPD